LSHGDSSQRILVYVQALPTIIPNSAKKFSDLESADYKMSHSSKVALAFASKNMSNEIVAAGFSPILREAVARGALKTFSMPLCDDPYQQFSFFPKEKFSTIIMGENPDWLFSGFSLGGIISAKLGLEILSADGSMSMPANSVVVVLDSGDTGSSIDIRRIELSQDTSTHPEGVLGVSSFRRLEETRPEVLTGSPEEVSSIISRRLRRITRT
jgi:hypothetical protein